jgi:hypothetical protein
MDPISTIALTLGSSWASGVNLYAAILTLGLMHDTGAVSLPPDLQILGNPLVLIAAGLLYLLEFVADKIPGVDSGWDALHTFIRIPAGAVLAYQATHAIDPALALAAGLVGGTMAGTSHAVKASSRVMINASPEPVTNWFASVTEDIAVVAGIWTAIHHPAVFLLLLVAFLALAIWLVPKIFRLLGRIFRFGRSQVGTAPDRPQSTPRPLEG